MENAYEVHKEAAARGATIVWIASGVFLYIATENANLWPTLIFIFVGVFAGELVFGGAHHLAQRGIVKLLMPFIKAPTARAAVPESIGFVMMAIEPVIIYLVARWVFHRFAV